MITYKNFVDVEIENFKKGWAGGSQLFDILSKQNIKIALEKALNDALNQSARRNKLSYKNLNIVEDFIDEFYKFATISKKYNTNSFNCLFDNLINKFIVKLKKHNFPKEEQFGLSQKFISMSFKYIYCFNDAKKTNFEYCRLPLDIYTINWYKRIGDPEYKNQFKKINFSWSRIEKELYDNIQKDIDNKLALKCSYMIQCKNNKKEIELPKNKLEVEFIIWAQEKNKVAYKKLLKIQKETNKYYSSIKDLM